MHVAIFACQPVSLSSSLAFRHPFHKSISRLHFCNDLPFTYNIDYHHEMCGTKVLPVDEMSAVTMHPQLRVEIQALERVFVLE